MKKSLIIFYALFVSTIVYGQVFETPAPEEGYEATPGTRVGGDFALQFQFLKHHADSTLIPLGTGINLPTANLNITSTLADGIEVNLTTYLSSRHHVEAWVKGGYLLFDKLPFIKSGFISRMMDYLTVKVGVMELNYGDAHFRRSDNGHVIHNMFVGNYIMDAFTTAPGLEVLYRNKGILLMGALTSGTLNPSLAGYNASSQTYTPFHIGRELAFYWKAGFDKQLSDALRVRATLSGYHAANNHMGSLYMGDRTGSRYYLVMNLVKNSPDDVNPARNHLSGNWGPGSTDRSNSFMLNLFTRYKALEFFGTVENAKGTTATGGNDFTFRQYALESLARFGRDDCFFAGARYNHVSGNGDQSVNRLQIGGGWFLTPDILIKAEYVDQNYSDFDIYGDKAGFNGLMLEATVSFGP